MTKNVTITDEAYERLKNTKQVYESFTDAILWLTKKKKLADFAGLLSDSEADILVKRIESSRKASRRRLEELGKSLRE